MRKHLDQCHSHISEAEVPVLSSPTKVEQLKTLEALFIKWLKPQINVQQGVKDQRRLLVINPVKPAYLR